MMEEQAYRQLVDDTFRRIDDAFADVDPDQAESTLSQGSLTIVFPGGVRAIVSPQPPVRQIWLAFRDRAWHFNYDEPNRRWLDDRGQGRDLFAELQSIAKETGNVDVKI